MDDAERGMERARWWLLALVFIAIMLNYVDRQIIALLKPTLQAEFDWSDRDYGHMASAFQFAAAFGYLAAGWFIDRVGLRRGFALGVGVWSLACMAHAFARTVVQFVVARAVLGFAEAMGTPAAVKSAATFFGVRQRTIALGIVNTAPNIGAVITPLAIPAFAVAFGWKAAFIVAGALGLVWVLAWWLSDVDRYRVAATAAAPEVEKVPWSHLLKDRRTVAIAAAKVLSDSVWWFLLFWLPDLFHRMFGLSQGTIGLPVALVYAMAACGALSGGWLPSKLLARGWSVNRARKTTLFLYAALVTPVAFVGGVDGPWAAALLIGLALFAHQGFSTNIFAFTTDVFPARVVGSVIGIAAFFGNLAGVVTSEAAAISLESGWGYTPMFVYAASAYLIGATLVHLIVPVIRSQEEVAAA
jgi:MFS transporter, ACS family, hexuronate transporter